MGQPNTSDEEVQPPDRPEGRTARRGRGRPRDPGLERRALGAALDVYGERGWSGLTLDEVAARAGVGKSSLYLRWKDKATLLGDAMRREMAPPEDTGAKTRSPAAGSDGTTEDSGSDRSLREYLIDHAMRRATMYLGPHGLAVLRLYVDTRALPDVFTAIREESMTASVLAERHRVERAIREGALPPGASAVQLLDAIEGAVLVHVLVTPPHLMDRVRETIQDYVEQMVDNQLRAAGFAVQPSRKLTPKPPRG